MRKDRGFTLVEMLVVISILGILIALVVVAAIAVREQAVKKRVQAFAGQVERVLAFDCAVILDLNSNKDDRCDRNVVTETTAPSIPFTQGVDGRSDGALELAEGDFIVAANVSDVSGGSWAIQAWVKPTVVPTGTQYIVGTGASGPDEIYVRMEGSTIQAYMQTMGAQSLTKTTVFKENQWTHILFSYDAAAQQAVLYVGDEIVDSASSVPGITGTFALWWIGSYDTAGTSNFRGAIDNVRIYTETVGSGF